MNDAEHSVIRVGVGNTVLGILWVGFIAITASVGFALAVTSSFSLILRLICLVAGALSTFWTWRAFRRQFLAEGRLRIELGDDAIEFSYPDRGPEVFRRSDVELIELNEGGFNGVGSFSVYGPGNTLLDIWETNWVLKPPQLVMRLLQRHGYPYALTSALYGERRFYQRPGRPVDDVQ